jgi:hypothetical protein
MSSDRYYRLSGKVPGLALVLMLVFGAATGLVLGPIYSVAVYYIPIIYFNFLLSLGLGLAVAWVVVQGAKLGKARNPWVVAGLSGVGALAALYAGWVFWVSAVVSWKFFIWRPDVLWQVMGRINEVGVWSIGHSYSSSGQSSSAVSGLLLSFVWVGEAAIIVGFAGYIGWKVASDLLFCESCGRWVTHKKTYAFAPVSNYAALRAEVEEGSDKFLLRLRPLPPGAARTELVVHTCGQCTDKALLTVNDVATRLVKGKATPVTTGIVKPIVMEHGISDLIEAWRNQPPADAPAEAASDIGAPIADSPQTRADVRDTAADALATLDAPEPPAGKPG